MEMFVFNLIHKLWSISSMLKSNVVASFKEAFIYPPAQNMNIYVRLELFLIGSVFLLAPMILNAVFDMDLQWLLLLPLMSIYLISAAIIGYEPLYETIKQFNKHHHWHHHKPASMSHP